MPEAVVRPASAGEIAAVLRLANETPFPVTPRGLGTGLSGGALAVRGGIVLSLERLDRILEIDEANLMAVVQPAALNHRFFPKRINQGRRRCRKRCAAAHPKPRKGREFATTMDGPKQSARTGAPSAVCLDQALPKTEARSLHLDMEDQLLYRTKPKLNWRPRKDIITI